MRGLRPRMFRLQVVALGVIVLAVAGGTFVALGSTESAWVTVDANKKFDERVSLDEELDVYIVEKGNRLIALSNRGPYDDEPAFYCASSQLFETERSGSKFDLFGRFFYGPAPRGMSRYELRVRDGDIQVKTSALIPGPPRGSG